MIPHKRSQALRPKPDTLPKLLATSTEHRQEGCGRAQLMSADKHTSWQFEESPRLAACHVDRTRWGTLPHANDGFDT